MNATQKKCLAGAIACLVLVACGDTSSAPANRGSNNPSESPAVSPAYQAAVGQSPAPNTVTVTIYKADDSCEARIPTKIAVAAHNSLKATVGKVLEPFDTKDFDLVDYQVAVNEKSGVATVNMRLSPNSKRRFVSLSSCEQTAFFGSLNKTLTSNPAWKIKSVRFTEQGKEIEL